MAVFNNIDKSTAPTISNVGKTTINSKLLLESGFKLLLENGFNILLETSAAGTSFTNQSKS